MRALVGQAAILVGLVKLLCLVPSVPLTSGQGSPSTCLISGRVVWPEHDLAKATVQLFRDAGFSDRAASVRCTAAGSYLAPCEAGTYHLMGFVDLDGDGKPTQGDGVAFYGVTDANDQAQRPTPLVLEERKGFARVDLRVTSVISADGRPQPIPTDALSGEVRVPRPISDTTPFFAGPPGSDGGVGEMVEIAGRLKAATAEPAPPAWALAAGTPTFEDVQSVALVDPQTGTFRLHACTEKVFVACVVDADANWSFDPGDLVGVYGLPETGQALAGPIPVRDEGETRIELAATAAVEANGSAVLPDGRAIVGFLSTELPPILMGSLTGPDVPRVVLRLFADSRFRLPLGAVSVAGDRPFAIPAPDVVGVYVVALFDADGNGETSPGDGLGFYGVSNLMSDKPKPVVLTPGTVVRDVNIRATALVGEDGKLKALPV